MRRATPLLTTVRRTLGRHAMVAPGMRVVVAVSGGPDSLAMLHVLHELRAELGISLLVAHLDHGFRAEGQQEAAFVQRLAESLAIPFVSGKADVPGMRATARGPQDAARQARYAFLNRVADERQAGRIAVGHTADDQAETLLAHLLRGAGSRGMAGMAAVQGRVIRPLLSAWRTEVEMYCGTRGLQPLRDPSNLDRRYLRNRIRTELLPQLASYNPRVRERLVALATILADQDDLVNRLAEAAAGEAVGDNQIKRAAFHQLHPAVQRGLLRRLFPDLTFEQVEAARSALRASPGRSFQIDGRLHLVTAHESVSVGPPTPAVTPFDADLPVPGSVTLPSVRLHLQARRCRCSHQTASSPGKAHVDLDTLALPLNVGPRRRGERFQPLGMQHRKRVQDFLVDRKVPQAERDRIPMVRDRSGIIWIPGLTITERARITPESTRILHLEINHF